MIDPEKLAAFAVVSATTSLIPGPSMLFVMGQAVRRGGRSGAAALAGVQLGYVWWWFLAALGLGTLASAFPLAFHVLAIGGALYLAWLGFQAIRHAGEVDGARPGGRKPSRRAFRDGIIVAMSNPKSLVYIVALLPPFVDSESPVVPQIVVLALLAMVIDVALGAIYILAGNRMAQAMTRSRTRLRVDRSIGAIYLVIAAAILVDLLY
jgi:threonine/homoserine/homoserine lactone efflux protein